MAGNRGDQRKCFHGDWVYRLRLGDRMVLGEKAVISTLKIAAIWALFLIVLPLVSAVCWVAVWWFDRGNKITTA